MKIDLKSYLALTSVLGSFFLFSLSGCHSQEKLPIGSGEVSLKADRSNLDDLRKDIPEEKRIENDELALILQLMDQKDRKPIEIREKFNTIMRKKRETFDRTQRRTREEFSHLEKASRDEFTKKQRDERDKLYASKPDAEEKRRFTQKQNDERDRFNSDSRDRRNTFEEDMRAKYKDFEAIVSDKNKEFSDQFKTYTQEYNERTAAEKLKGNHPPAEKLESK